MEALVATEATVFLEVAMLPSLGRLSVAATNGPITPTLGFEGSTKQNGDPHGSPFLLALEETLLLGAAFEDLEE